MQKNIKVSDTIHEDLKEWCEHKEIKIVDIIDKIINTGLMTEKYGLSFFQSIIEKEGYVSTEKQSKREEELKKEFFEKGLVQGYEKGKVEGFKESQNIQKKSKDLKDQKDKKEQEEWNEKPEKSKDTKEKLIEGVPHIEIPQYDPEDIYGESKNTRFIRLEQKRNK
ncbi:hypothetical protein COB55_03655 [Candidatus Wolfebacteria bacterium]|nr:MAG: hypothetical protein COB55_03655 [Candidatus Wolfebacteria bacterium]